MFVSAGNKEIFKDVLPIGVGSINATMSINKLCLFHKPEFLLFFGSAGSYGKHDILDVVESSSSANIELSFLEDNSYTPLDNACRNDINFCKNDSIVNSSNYITTNPNLGSKLLDYGIALENMEFFSIMSVAKEFKIPVGGVFVITNKTNKNAHEDYEKNIYQAMSILNNQISRFKKKLYK